MSGPYLYAWGNNPMRAKYKGKECRVVAWMKRNTVVLDFGLLGLLVSSRHALRKKN